MNSSRVTAAALEKLFSAYELHCMNEAELHATLSSILDGDEIPYEREVRLCATDRVDFLVDAIAIECKVDGSLSDLTRQVHRYAQHDAVREILVVSTRMRHRGLPSEIRGKCVLVLYVWPL